MVFKQRLLDNNDGQEWDTPTQISLVLDYYKLCKTTLSYENYLKNLLLNKNYTFLITRIKISIHTLRSEFEFGQNRLHMYEYTSSSGKLC
jgi:hypothetical protein